MSELIPIGIKKNKKSFAPKVGNKKRNTNHESKAPSSKSTEKLKQVSNETTKKLNGAKLNQGTSNLTKSRTPTPIVVPTPISAPIPVPTSIRSPASIASSNNAISAQDQINSEVVGNKRRQIYRGSEEPITKKRTLTQTAPIAFEAIPISPPPSPPSPVSVTKRDKGKAVDLTPVKLPEEDDDDDDYLAPPPRPVVIPIVNLYGPGPSGLIKPLTHLPSTPKPVLYVPINKGTDICQKKSRSQSQSQRKRKLEEDAEAARKRQEDLSKKRKTVNEVNKRRPLVESSVAPQVRLVDGEIVLDKESLSVSRSSPNYEALNFDPEESMPKDAVIKSYYSPAWTPLETQKFYDGLSQYGTDFEKISSTLPGRTRAQVKTKYNREEGLYPEKINKYLFIKKRKAPRPDDEMEEQL